MSQERFKIPRTSDRMLIEVFRKLSVKYSVNSATVKAVAGITFKVNLFSDDPKPNLDEVLSHDSNLIETVSTQHHALTITYFRGGYGNVEQKSPIYDEIQVDFSDNQPNPSVQERLAMVAFLEFDLKRFEVGRITAAEASPEIGHILSVHQSNLARLEKLNEELINRSAEFRDGLERKFEEKVTANDEKFEQTKADLFIKNALKDDELQAREAAVKAKLAAIDDRNNTHVRREIRDGMLNDIKKRIEDFGVSYTTERKRSPVRNGIVALVAAITLLLVYTVTEISFVEAKISISISQPVVIPANAASSPSVQTHAAATGDILDKSSLYWLWARFGILSLSLFGTLIYYIKWQSKWADQHAASEFQLQQFYVDVNRANWVIESCLEWKKETQSEVPSELLSSITKGLFFNLSNEPETVLHPADALASALLGSSSKAKLKIGDSEVEFDKPAKIPKTIATA